MIKVLLAFVLGLICFAFGGYLLLKDEDFSEPRKPAYILERTKSFEGISSEILIHKGFVWIFTKDDNLVKLDTKGDVLDTYKIPFGKLSQNFLIEDNVLYAISNTKTIFAYDLGEKKLLWTFDSPKKTLAGLVFSDAFLVFGSYDFKLYVLDAKTGNVYREYESKEAINDKVLVDGSKVYFGDCSGDLTCFDIKTGEAFSKPISEHLPTSPILGRDSILLLDYQNTIFSLNKSTLEENWNLDSDASKLYSFGGNTFALSSDFSVLDEDAKSLKTLLSLDESLELMEEISSQKYALISNYGTLYIYEKNAVVFQYKFGVDLYDIKAYSDKIFIIDSDKNMYIIKANEQ